MKFCPKCQTKYDEEVIRFCTKDGAPLVEENPSFTAMPSQSSIDDIGDETLTLISIKRPNLPPLASSTPPPPPLPVDDFDEPAPRVVISIGEDKKQAVRPIEQTAYQQPSPRKSNTALVVFLTLFGTFAILGGGFGLWWFLSSPTSPTANVNSNTGANNANIGVNYNSAPDFNFNALNNSNVNGNSNSNVNTNANTNTNVNKTPSPTKTPTPKPSPNTNVNININANTVVNITPSNSNAATNIKTPTITPTPTATPKPSASPTPTAPSNVNVGNLNSRATSLPKPAYPQTAKQMGAAGQVMVQVSVDESGNVLSAKAISGHQLLRSSAEAAARQSRFNPIKVGDKPVRANGMLVYNFINQ